MVTVALLWQTVAYLARLVAASLVVGFVFCDTHIRVHSWELLVPHSLGELIVPANKIHMHKVIVVPLPSGPSFGTQCPRRECHPR
jgi:hypothetical protein